MKINHVSLKHFRPLEIGHMPVLEVFAGLEKQKYYRADCSLSPSSCNYGDFISQNTRKSVYAVFILCKQFWASI